MARAGKPRIVNGFMEVEGCGTGIMLIERGLVKTMLEKMPELSDTGAKKHSPLAKNLDRLIRAFDPVTVKGARLSEDYSFCHRWRTGCGGEVWANISHPITHVGLHRYSGRYQDAMPRGPRITLGAQPGKAAAAATGEWRSQAVEADRDSLRGPGHRQGRRAQANGHGRAATGCQAHGRHPAPQGKAQREVTAGGALQGSVRIARHDEDVRNEKGRPRAPFLLFARVLPDLASAGHDMVGAVEERAQRVIAVGRGAGEQERVMRRIEDTAAGLIHPDQQIVRIHRRHLDEVVDVVARIKGGVEQIREIERIALGEVVVDDRVTVGVARRCWT